jgi:selenide,water dikinase
MTEASGVGATLWASRLPWLPGARALAEGGHWSGGMKRNRRHVDTVLGARLQIDPAVPSVTASLLTESETSGGLLLAVAPARAAAVIDAFRARGEPCWEIGEVGGSSIRVAA